MKRILAIALSFIMLGSVEVKAKKIEGKEAENIIVKGKVIGSFPSGNLIVIYKNRYYHCLSRVTNINDTPLSLLCWGTDD